MSANLYRDTMAFHGVLPWHQMGTHFEEPMTTEEAIAAAKLDFTVSKEPVYRKLGGEFVEVEDRFITVNDFNQKVLGFVGNQYTPLQQREAFGFFEVFMAETGARFETAGAIGNGERVWMLAKVPGSFEPLLGDLVNRYVLLTNGHDGSLGVGVRFTPIRVVCQNTLTAAIAGTRSTVSLLHTKGVKGRLEQAAMILREMNAHFAAIGERFQQLAEFRIDDEWIADYERALFGEQPRADVGKGVTLANWNKKVEAFENNLHRGMGVDLPGVAGSAWGAYNAATEYADFDFPARSTTDRTELILFGRADAFKQKAMEAAFALVTR